MYIPKPLRVLGNTCVAGVATVATVTFLHPRIGFWTFFLLVLVVPVSFTVSDIIINIVDEEIRKRTKDPIWVMQHKEKNETQQQSGRDVV